METYKTSDFNLACYLYAHWLQYLCIEGWKSYTERCNFVFTVPEAVNLVLLLSQRASPNTEGVRMLLFKSKLLKTELKKYYSLLRAD